MRDQAEDTVNMRASNSQEAGVHEAEASEMRASAGEVTAQSADIRVPATLGAMQQLARYLSGIPGRKNLVWFSGSFPIDLMPNTLDPQDASIMRNYAREVRETGRLLSAARIAVYSIYAGTPRATNSLHASHDLVVSDQSKVLGASRDSRNDTKAEIQIQSEQASMISVADLTGGQFFNTTEIKEAVASAINNGSSYYTVSYVPGGKLDGKFRKLKVQIDGATYDLAYRLGFYADSSDKPSPHNPGETSPITVASMLGAPTATEIQFQARVLAATDPALQGSKLPEGPAGAMTASLKGTVQRYIVDLKIDPHGFAFADTPDGGRQASVEFVLVGYDAKGKRVNFLDNAGQVNLDPSQFAQLMMKGINQRLALDLPAGQMALRIVIYDQSAGRAGSLEVPLAVGAN
jgi:VWFA-related protein